VFFWLWFCPAHDSQHKVLELFDHNLGNFRMELM
jgi:hypothetical protein